MPSAEWVTNVCQRCQCSSSTTRRTWLALTPNLKTVRIARSTVPLNTSALFYLITFICSILPPPRHPCLFRLQTLSPLSFVRFLHRVLTMWAASTSSLRRLMQIWLLRSEIWRNLRLVLGGKRIQIVFNSKGHPSHLGTLCSTL